MRTVRRTIFLLALAAAVPAAAREPDLVLPKPIILRLLGHFAPDRERAQAEGVDAVMIAVDDVQRWFAVDRARTIGDHALDGRDVLALLAPTTPNLIAVGADDLRRRLRDAPPGTPVEIEGLVERGSHTYLLRRATVGAPAAE
jgi:hypothetical protein